MCDPITMMTMGTAALSTALNVTQQLQHAAQQRGDYNYVAAQQRKEVDVAESRARQAEAAGEADALSLRYDGMRDAWENRVQGARRQAQARYYETAAANVDPTPALFTAPLGIARSLLS